jgi:uncharacterized protein (TIGR00255 family)
MSEIRDGRSAMPYSMTGFAAADTTAGPFHLLWEVRSVNHRFLDLSVRLPEELRALEPRCRETVSAVLRRGKVDCTLRLAVNPGASDEERLDEDSLARLEALQVFVQQRFPEARPLAIGEILRWPGVVVAPRQDAASLERPVLACLEQAVASLQEARAREGERIAEFLTARIETIGSLLGEVRPRLDALQTRYRGKLEERLARLKVEVAAERFEQEVVFVLQRLDVEEEIDRLGGHSREVRRILGEQEPIGRRLDFLVQELNREANTFASKAQDEDLARVAVDLKVLVEQMREQVQNLE